MGCAKVPQRARPTPRPDQTGLSPRTSPAEAGLGDSARLPETHRSELHQQHLRHHQKRKSAGKSGGGEGPTPESLRPRGPEHVDAARTLFRARFVSPIPQNPISGVLELYSNELPEVQVSGDAQQPEQRYEDYGIGSSRISLSMAARVTPSSSIHTQARSINAAGSCR